MSEPDWRTRLRGGDCVRIRFSGAFYVTLGLATVGTLFFAFAWFKIAVFLLTGQRDGMTPARPADMAIFVVFGLIWIGFSIFAWSSFFRCAIRFAQAEFRLWDWRGRAHQYELARVRAVAFRRPFGKNPIGRRDLRIRYAYPQSAERWIDLGSRFGWQTGFAEAVRDELIERCQLSKSMPVAGRLFDWEMIWSQGPAACSNTL
jgi:hypothetical protein